MGRIYDNAESVEAVAKTLIPSYHPELATARIRYVYVDKASNKGGKVQLIKVRKVSGVLQFLLDLDFLVEVPLDKWNELSAAQRNALVDHGLERCYGQEDEEDPGAPMKWVLRDPDVQEFGTILRRHGAWNPDLAGFTSIAQGIDIDEVMGAQQGEEEESDNVSQTLS